MIRPEIIIEFRLDPRQPSRFLAIPIDEMLVREAMQSVDFPSPSADTITRAFFCTPPDEIARRLKSREEVDNILRGRITHLIYEALSRRDTEMGYPKRSV